MRTLFGSIFVVIVLFIIYHILIDPYSGMFRDTSQFTIAYVGLLAFIGLLGFILISGRGHSKNPRPSRYDH